MSYFWLSFADGDLPKGQQFLGACIVQAETNIDAVTKAHLLGINPGGEVMMVEIESAGAIKEILENHPLNTLLSKAMIENPVSLFTGDPV